MSGNDLPTVVVSPSEPPAQQVMEYQVTDENGQPLGRPTRIVYNSLEDLVEKQKTIHTEATRAIFRARNQKPDPRRDKPSFTPTADDGNRRRAEVREIIEAELGAPLDAVRRTLKEANDVAEYAEANNFIAAHGWKDYYPCDQNTAKMLDWLRENSYAVTTKNLEIAMQELNTKGELLPIPVATNPALPPPANPAPAPRPTPSSGIVPGQMAGVRPSASAGLTKKDIAEMTPADYRQALRNPQKRAEIERALAG